MSVQQNKKRGYEFENEIIRGLKMALSGDLVYKIPDVKTFGHLMTWKVPADIIASIGGKIITIEAKQTKLSRIPFANFKQHQIDWAKANPHSAYFVINFNNRKDINKTFFVSSTEWRYLELEYKRSIPMEAFSFELERKTARFHPTKEGAFISFDGIDW